MKNEQIREFTLRITQSNRSELIVVLYEIMETYLNEAMEREAYSEWKEAVRNASRVVFELQGALDMQYEIAGELNVIYDFLGRALEMAVVRKNKEELPRLYRMVDSLKETFEKVAETDTSPALMRNTEQVYAGLTYGKTDLVEQSGETSLAGRGFFA